MTATVTLLGSLLPGDWKDRVELLTAAARVDVRHGPAGADVLLSHFQNARATDALPADADLSALVLALRELLGGIGEPRRRPREEAIA